MRRFGLDKRLAADTTRIMRLGLCDLRLMDEARWPWLILVPQRLDIAEIHELSPHDQTMLTFEMTATAEALKRATGCLKINTGALGNIVRQLHVHVIARSEGDPGWPGPVWGFGQRIGLDEGERERLCEAVRAVM
ncbi:MAG TPA: HIT family protein [Rhizobiaceae bacterium]|nr:HIT family protein [Rhizobiaceae bacterium]